MYHLAYFKLDLMMITLLIINLETGNRCNFFPGVYVFILFSLGVHKCRQANKELERIFQLHSGTDVGTFIITYFIRLHFI
jgi:hypothetical protein